MDFNLSEEQRLLRDGAQRYFREQHSFLQYRELIREDQQPDDKHWLSFAELGWHALPVQEQFGGLGFGLVDVAILMEEVGRSLVVDPYLSSTVLCTRLLERAGSLLLREQVLPSVIEGKTVLALAFAEPGKRYETTPETIARHANGSYELHGKKTLVLGGPQADMLLVTAMLDGELALFSVDASAAGVARHDYLLIDRSGCSDVEFQNTVVDKEALVAVGSVATELLDEALDRATIAVSAQILGVMEAALEATGDHVKSRIAFNAPLGKLQAVQHLLAEAFIEVQESRSILYRGLAEFDASARSRRLAASAAKAYIGPSAKQVCGICVQLHGGYGITDEYLVGHCYRKVVLLEKLFGDTFHHTERVASLAFPVVSPS